MNIFVSFHSSIKEAANSLVSELKPLFDADFEIPSSEFDESEKMKYCDAFLVIANTDYVLSQEMSKDFSDFIDFGKPVIKLNLEPDLILKGDSAQNVTKIDLYQDENKSYLNGEGKVFVDLVFELCKKLPKTLVQNEKSLDLLIIMPKELKKIFKKFTFTYSVKYSHPGNVMNPNLWAVKDSKVVLVVINAEFCRSAQSIVELKFAQEIGVEILTIEDPALSNLNREMNEILSCIPSKNRLNGQITERHILKSIESKIEEAVHRNNFKQSLSNFRGSEENVSSKLF